MSPRPRIRASVAPLFFFLAAIGCYGSLADPSAHDAPPGEIAEPTDPGAYLVVPEVSEDIVFPVEGGPHWISQGPRSAHPNAWDIAAREGAPVRAVADGVITRIKLAGGRRCSSGPSCSNTNANWVVVEHNFGGRRISSLYLHMQNEAEGSPLLCLQPGDTVRQGQILGYVGETGYATGPHLHFQFQVSQSSGCSSYWCSAIDYRSIRSSGFRDAGVIAEGRSYSGADVAGAPTPEEACGISSDPPAEPPPDEPPTTEPPPDEPPPDEPPPDEPPPSTSCPSGNGLYCGSASLGLNPSHLYDCQGGRYTFHRACVEGCYVAPPGTADRCNPGVCPYGNGAYCGDPSLGLNPEHLYDCQGGAYRLVEACTRGCYVAPPGSPDVCM